MKYGKGDFVFIDEGTFGWRWVIIEKPGEDVFSKQPFYVANPLDFAIMRKVRNIAYFENLIDHELTQKYGNAMKDWFGSMPKWGNKSDNKLWDELMGDFND